MKGLQFDPGKDGGCGTWYENPNGSDCVMISSLG